MGWYAITALLWSAQNHKLTTTSFLRNTILKCHRTSMDHNADTNICKLMQQHSHGSMIFNSECTRNHLLAGLCPYPLSGAHSTPSDSPAGSGGGDPRLGRNTKKRERKGGSRGEEGEGKEEKGERDKVPYRHFSFPNSSPVQLY